MGTKNLFKKGNKAWERRSRHGIEKTIKSAKLLLDAFNDYHDWCVDNPLVEIKPMVVSDGKGEGSSVDKVEVNRIRAMTLAGFCVFMGTNRQYWGTFKAQLKVNGNTTETEVSDFNKVIRFIEDAMFQQKFEAAAAGLLKENLIARELGLADKTENKNENTNMNSVPMTKEEIKEMSKELNDEY